MLMDAKQEGQLRPEGMSLNLYLGRWHLEVLAIDEKVKVCIIMRGLNNFEGITNVWMVAGWTND